VTARWVVDEVAPNRDLRITWQPISLMFKNDIEPDNERYDVYYSTHRMLRVMESVRASEGDDAVFGLYWEYGRRIHHDRDRDFDIAEALKAVDLDEAHAAAADDESWDATITERMAVGIDLAGDDIGTPIIAFDDRKGVKQAYFGPVMTRVPPTEDSLAMWDALVAMMNVEGFWELKRTRTDRAEFGERP
jgi:hypothetical protein